jgi:HSP20 family protein
MSTLSQIREGLSRAWDSITEGWRELREVAAEALTRFSPAPTDDASEVLPQRRSVRWGLLAAEVADDAKDVVVKLEVPGMSAEDFELEVVGDVLVVRGEKRVSWDNRVGDFYVSERAYGRFERAVQLPTAVKEEDAKARYEAGVLTVRLPKAETRKRSRITIEAD